MKAKILEFSTEQKEVLDEHRAKTGIPTAVLIDTALTVYLKKQGIVYPAKTYKKRGRKPAPKPQVTVTS